MLWKPFFKLLSPTESSHWPNQVTATRHLIIFAWVVSMVSIFHNAWEHLCFQQLQRRRPAPTSRVTQPCLQMFLRRGFSSATLTVDSWEQIAEASAHVETVPSQTLHSFIDSPSSPVPWKSQMHKDASSSFESSSYKVLQQLRKKKITYSV